MKRFALKFVRLIGNMCIYSYSDLPTEATPMQVDEAAPSTTTNTTPATTTSTPTPDQPTPQVCSISHFLAKRSFFDTIRFTNIAVQT